MANILQWLTSGGRGTWSSNIRGGAAGNLKSYPILESPENDILSVSKIFLSNTLSFSFCRQNCALQGNLYEIYGEMWKYCLPSNLNHICRMQMAKNDLLESKMTNVDPVMEPIFIKMIPCPGVGILKMIPCSAARPHTEKCMITPPGLTSTSLLLGGGAVGLGPLISYGYQLLC